MSDSREFDWGDIDADIVVPEQPAIACYTNPNGAVVLRQAGQYGLEDDHWVYFHADHAVAVAYAILNAAGLTMQIVQCQPNGCCDVPQPKDRTAAERQKRYRERKRNARNTEAVTRNAQDRDVLPLRTDA